MGQIQVIQVTISKTFWQRLIMKLELQYGQSSYLTLTTATQCTFQKQFSIMTLRGI